jgi:hypothetical protein
MNDIEHQGAGAEAKPNTVEPSDKAVLEFVDAVNSLGADSRYLLRSLTEYTKTLSAVRPSELSDEQRTFLVESGTFSAAELERTEARIARGSFQIDSLLWWLSELYATLSLEDPIAFLGYDEGKLEAAVPEGRLYGVDIGGRWRLPMFQFSLRSPGKILPHLDALLPALLERWDWLGMSRFFSTRQEDLSGLGWKTPAQWLEDGGDPQHVLNIVRGGELWW